MLFLSTAILLIGAVPSLLPDPRSNQKLRQDLLGRFMNNLSMIKHKRWVMIHVHVDSRGSIGGLIYKGRTEEKPSMAETFVSSQVSAFYLGGTLIKFTSYTQSCARVFLGIRIVF